MTIADAVHGYNLFLGRQPDSQRVAEERSAVPMAESIAAFLNSDEFLTAVLKPLIAGHPLPNVSLSAFPSDDIKDWVSGILPSDGARSAAEQAKTWRQLLIALLRDESLFKSAGLTTEHSAFSLLAAALQSRRHMESEREVIGSLDEISATEIRGWAANLLDLEEAPRLEFLLDNIFIGVTKCNRFRRDIQESLKGHGYYGFSFILPAAHHAIAQRERLLTVRDVLSRQAVAAPVRVRMGQTDAIDSLVQIRRNLRSLKDAVQQIEEQLPEILRQASYPLEMYSEFQHECQRQLRTGDQQQDVAALQLTARPRFTIVIDGPIGRVTGLASSIKSLMRQSYDNWECLVAGVSAGYPAERSEVVETFTLRETRLREVEIDSAASRDDILNGCVLTATGDYLIFLAQGDVLTDDALFELARAVQSRSFDLLYFDEDDVDVDDTRHFQFSNPRLKHAFDYDFLLAADYIGRAFAVSRTKFGEAGCFGGQLGAVRLFDLTLRLIEIVDPINIHHVARILYHNVTGAKPAAIADGTTAARDAERLASIGAHFARTGCTARAEMHDDPHAAVREGRRRIVWPLPDPAPTISIIIPTRDEADMLKQCLESVLATREHYPGRFEIVIVDNDSREAETINLFEEMQATHGVITLSFKGAFNWAAMNNFAARRVKGDILIFLNNDTVVISPDWARELASIAARPSVGAVGARLLYEDGTIQHAGVVMGVSGGAIHEGIGQSPSDGGYDGRTMLQHRALAVTGACLATRADVFSALGGFDEINLGVEFNDTDYCLRAHDQGLAVIYTPFATLYHFESKSRGIDRTDDQRRRSLRERNVVTARWRKYLDNDPFYNAHFDRAARPFSRLRPVSLMSERMALTQNAYWDISL